MILQGVLNRLLGHSPDAVRGLLPFAGRTVRIVTPLKSALLVITDDGRFGSSAAEPEATLSLPFSFFMLRTHDPVAAARQIDRAGAQDLADGAGEALARLRWDAAEELSELVGDVLAHRLIKLAGKVGGIPGAIGSRLLMTYGEYWRDENPLLPRAEKVEKWQAEIEQFRSDIARLEKRITKLE